LRTFKSLFLFIPALFLCCLSVLLFATGCGISVNKSAGAESPSAPTVTISATPVSVTANSRSMLSVTAANTTAVTITGTDGSIYTLPANGGTQAINPAKTTTYTATAAGTGGKVSAATTVTVSANPAPVAPTVSIAATPASIIVGSASTLTVTAANATQVTVTGTDGSSYALPGNGGTQAVRPTATATYTVIATGPAGTASATATVTVMPPPAPAPTVSISANPASISAENSTTLTVAATNAAQITVTGTDGSSYALPGIGGTQAVSPTATATYTATATGPGGKATATAIITVTPNPEPAVKVTASPTSITANSSSLLAVAAMNATQVTVAGTDGSSYTLQKTGGTQPVSPAATTTYTVTAVGPGGKASATTILTVTPNPAPSVTLTAIPASITAGGSSTLTVNAVTATQVTITGSDGSRYTPPSSSATQSVSPVATTTYTAVATGPGGTTSTVATVTVAAVPPPTATISASPSSLTSGNSATLTVTATNTTQQLTINGDDGTSYSLPASGGTLSISPKKTTTYKATVTGQESNASDSTTVTVTAPAPGDVTAVDHVIFMLQENHSFDNYFGMLNPYRLQNHWTVGDDGKTYTVDGIDDKLQTISNVNDEGTSFSPFKFTSTCVDDESSSWLESYGDVSRYNYTPARPIVMDGFVHTAEGYAKSCKGGTTKCAGSPLDDLAGQRAMGYYDGDFLNYYYYMASNFAISDRWFSPVSSKSVPNRIATYTGGTTQGLAFDPGNDDQLPQLAIPTIFSKLEDAKVSWKIYYTVTQGGCTNEDDCSATGNANYPATTFSSLQDSYKYLYIPASGVACSGTTKPDSSNSFCVDPNHIAPLSQYYTDLTNGTLPQFAFIEAGYGHNDEHPGSGQSILSGQAEIATIVNALMNSSSWKDSVFFLSYDEAGGPFDHVPPVPGHSNDSVFGGTSVAEFEDISKIAVDADAFKPCLPPMIGSPTLNCDLHAPDPGANASDAPAMQGFAAQLGFRVPNMVISPFTRKHYVSHIPMDHTAIIKFVEHRFIDVPAHATARDAVHLTARDAAQPDLLDFFDFSNSPWLTPPTDIPPPRTDLSGSTCTPASFAPTGTP